MQQLTSIKNIENVRADLHPVSSVLPLRRHFPNKLLPTTMTFQTISFRKIGVPSICYEQFAFEQFDFRILCF